MNKISLDTAQKMLGMMRQGYKNHVIAKVFSIDRRRVSELRRGVTFKHLNRKGVSVGRYTRISPETVAEIRRWCTLTGKNRLIADMTGTSADQVANIRANRRWREDERTNAAPDTGQPVQDAFELLRQRVGMEQETVRSQADLDMGSPHLQAEAVGNRKNQQTGRKKVSATNQGGTK